MADRLIGRALGKMRGPLFGVTAIGAAISASCGGGESKDNSVGTQVPTAVASETSQPESTVTKVDAIPSDSESIPEEATKFLELVDTGTGLTDEQVGVLRDRFASDWQGAQDDDYLEYGAYVGLRSSLAANYKQTQDSEVLGVMNEIQQYLASNPEWSTFYNASLSDGAFEN